jgi:hypothetical protein
MSRTLARLATAVGPAALALALASASCGSSAADALDVGAGDDAGPVIGQLASGDAGAASLAVTASASATAICEGQCVALTASASGGQAPYGYAWDHGVAADGGAASVCPAATTPYTVTASDSSAENGGELASPTRTGTAAITLVVSACAPDAAAAPPGGGPLPEADAEAGLRVYQAINAPWTGITVGLREGATVYWTNWTTAAADTVSGILLPPSGEVTVTFTGADMWGSQTTAGSNPWTPATTFESAAVPDPPPGPGIIEINGGPGQVDHVTFSRPVTDPLVAVYSLGTGYLGNTVSLDFGAPCTVLSSGPDSYLPTGGGTLTAVDGGVSATEGSGVVEVQGTF